MRHIPVLLHETLQLLNLEPGMHVIDCTLGDAGHSEAILQVTAPDGKLLGIDADIEAVLRAKHKLYQFDSRVTFVRNNFSNLAEIVKKENFVPVHRILMDLGWSTPQFEERGRGFSFAKRNEPLDMRFGIGAVTTAEEILNTATEDELLEILEVYGEGEFAKHIASQIIEQRKKRPYRTVGHLVDTILDTYRAKLKSSADVPWIGGIHPATKVFQALRIAANDELGVVKQTIPQALEVLESGGRLAIITFHSLEDRIVKHAFKKLAGAGKCTLAINKPVSASPEEQKENPSSRSAKLRVIEKI